MKSTFPFLSSLVSVCLFGLLGFAFGMLAASIIQGNFGLCWGYHWFLFSPVAFVASVPFGLLVAYVTYAIVPNRHPLTASRISGALIAAGVTGFATFVGCFGGA